MQTSRTNLSLSVILALSIGLSACTRGQGSDKVAINDTCSLDQVMGGTGSPPLFTASTGADIVFQGWVADAVNARVPKKVKVQLVNTKNIVQLTDSGETGVKRGDVAVAFKAPTLEGAGFAVKTKLQGISPGEYDVLLVGIYDEQVTVCRSNRKVQVK